MQISSVSLLNNDNTVRAAEMAAEIVNLLSSINDVHCVQVFAAKVFFRRKVL